MAGVMILQEFTDPTLILASGGILDRVDSGSVGRRLGLAGAVTMFVLIPIGLIMAFVMRGKVGEPKAARTEAAA